MSPTPLISGMVKIVWITFSTEFFDEAMSAIIFYEGQPVTDQPFIVIGRSPSHGPKNDTSIHLMCGSSEGDATKTTTTTSIDVPTLRKRGELVLANWLNDKLNSDGVETTPMAGLTGFSSKDDLDQLFNKIEHLD